MPLPLLKQDGTINELLGWTAPDSRSEGRDAGGRREGNLEPGCQAPRRGNAETVSMSQRSACKAFGPAPFIYRRLPLRQNAADPDPGCKAWPMLCAAAVSENDLDGV